MKTFIQFITSLFPIRTQSITLKAVYITERAGERPKSLEQIKVIEQQGIETDRYQTHQGHWHRVESCQITLITTYELTRITKRTDISVADGEHRRNLVIDGVKPHQLKGRRFQIGEVMFEYHKPRPPCGYLDQVTGVGLAKAMANDCGCCIKALTSGEIKCGDKLIIVDSQE